MLPILPTLLLACGPGQQDPQEENLDQRACDFVGVGGLTIHAMSSKESDGLATIDPSDEPWTVTLDGEGSSWLRFELDEGASLRLYLDQADLAQELYRNDTPMGLPRPAPVDLCPDDIPERYRLELGLRGRYHLELGPTTAGTLWLMLQQVGG